MILVYELITLKNLLGILWTNIISLDLKYTKPRTIKMYIIITRTQILKHNKQ